MRTYKKTEVTYEEEELIETKCDLCGAVAKKGLFGSSLWEINETEVEVTVRHKEGSSYPEGGCGTKVDIDICPVCFKTKLMPWINSQGGNIKEEYWDW